MSTATPFAARSSAHYREAITSKRRPQPRNANSGVATIESVPLTAAEEARDDGDPRGCPIVNDLVAIALAALK